MNQVMLSAPVAAVTGARGLIGGYLVEELLAKGWKVRILSRKERSIIEDSLVSIEIGDINDEVALKALLNGADALFHCAAELTDESKMYDVNVEGTATLLKVMKQSSVRYFCHLSSAGVVGPTSCAVIDEDATCYPSSTYEQTKYEAEKLVLQENLRMKVCILRPANVFDGKKPGLAGLALRKSFKNKLSILLKGREGAHLVHAKDVAAAAIFFMEKDLEKPEIFFVSYDDDTRNTVAGIYQLCCAFNHENNGSRVLSLPSNIPYIMRIIFRGKSLHGRARFSEDKLKSFGFVFPLGLEDALRDVCKIDKVLSS